MANLQSEIQSLVSKFASDLESLVRKAAVDAVSSSLGGSSGTPAVAAPQRTGKKRGPKAKAAPAAKPAAGPSPKSMGIAPKSAKPGKRVRRTAEDIARLGQSIADYVAKNPGSNAEKIKAALKIPGNQWGLSIGWALDSKKLTRKGEKRAAVYSSAGGSAPLPKPSPVPPIKRQK